MKKSYNVNGCEEPEHNDVYDYKETTGNGSIWWRSRKYNKMLRFTPGWGWSLGWYTHTDCDSEILLVPDGLLMEEDVILQN